MEKVSVELELPKEAHELAEGIARFVVSVKGSLADGWDMSQDLPVLMSSALAELVPAVQGVEKLPEEAKEEPEMMSLALAVAVAKAVKAIRA